MSGSIAVAHRYRRDGYAVIPRVFDADTITAIKHDLDKTAGEQNPAADLLHVRSLSAWQRSGISRAASGDKVFIFGRLQTLIPRIGEHLTHPRIVALARLVLRRTGVAYHFSNVTRKSARIGPRIAWHRDFPSYYICPRQPTSCRIMVCLDGMDRRNGCTRFVKGSHRISDQRARAQARRRRRPPTKFDDAICSPGSAVIIHPKVLHGGAPNRSAQNRDNLVIQWGSAYSTAFSTTNREAWTGLSPAQIPRS